jgi:hypothetical protein
MIREATRRLIEAGLRHDAFYRERLANHLPMALVALDGLGADDARIAAFARHYAAQLEPLRTVADPILPGEEMQRLGQSVSFPAWREFFAASFEREGHEAVLRSCADRLLEGVAGGAFHGAIRTAYALEAQSLDELSHALAYWAAAWRFLGSPPRFAGQLGPAEVLAAMAADPALAGHRPEGRNIEDRTAAAARMPAVVAHAANIDPRRLDLDALATAALRAYEHSGDFTVLHMVTGVHAARALLPYARDAQAAQKHLAFALACAYAGTGCPAGAPAADDGENWLVIRERAVRCDDEHDVKLAYTCWREWQRTGDDLYRRVAAARVRHVREEAKA